MDSQETSEPPDVVNLRNIFRVMEEMRQARTFCDVTIRVGQASFAAHRLILAAGIPFFRGMFGNGYAESIREEITLYDVDSCALESLITLLYGGKLCITTENVETLLTTSSYLQFELATQLCFQFMLKQLDSGNALDIFKRAEECQCHNAIETSSRYIDENFEDVCKSEAFLSLPVPEIKQLIERDSLFVMNEETVFEAVMKWVKEDEIDRGVYLADLLPHIRLPLLTSEYPSNCSTPETRFVSACRGLLEATSSMEVRSSPRPGRYCERKEHLKYGKIMGSAMYSLSSTGRRTFALNYYDFVHENWVRLSSCLPAPYMFAFDSIIVCTDENIFFFRKRLTYVFCLKKLEIISRVTPCDISFGERLVVHHRKIYALGAPGVDADVVRSLCPKQGTCVEEGRLTMKRHCVSAVSLGEHVYVTGGCFYVPDDVDSVNLTAVRNAERYNPLTGHSVEISPMIQARYHHSSSILQGKICVCGGYVDEDTNDPIMSVELYDPLTDQWTFTAPMRKVMRNMSLVSCSGKLYAAERWKKGSSYSPEVYDLSDSKWKSGLRIPHPGHTEMMILVGTDTVSSFIV